MFGNERRDGVPVIGFVELSFTERVDQDDAHVWLDATGLLQVVQWFQNTPDQCSGWILDTIPNTE